MLPKCLHCHYSCYFIFLFFVACNSVLTLSCAYLKPDCYSCGYMKGGLPERSPALPILMLISSSRYWKDGVSGFSLATLDSGGRARAMCGSAPTPCGGHTVSMWTGYNPCQQIAHIVVFHRRYIIISSLNSLGVCKSGGCA